MKGLIILGIFLFLIWFFATGIADISHENSDISDKQVEKSHE
jgi:hypothetical protein